MTVREFLQAHPGEDVDLRVPEGRVLLESGQIRRLLAGRPVILCRTRRAGCPLCPGGGTADPDDLSGPPDPRPVAGVRCPRSEVGAAGSLLAKTEKGELAMNNRGKNVGLLLTGMALGAALCGGAAAAGIVAVPTWQPIFVDGRQVEMEAYNINGSNYVKLRDAGKQVGFNVYWQDGVQVDTGSPYTGVAPVEEAAETEMDVSVIRQEVVDRTNQLRREAGIPALETDPMLTQAAQVRAEEMAAAGTYSHTRPDGSQYYTVADCPYMAENIHRIADRRLKTLERVSRKLR